MSCGNPDGVENPQQLGPRLSYDTALLRPAGVSQARCFLLPFDVSCVGEGSAPLWVRARSLARSTATSSLCFWGLGMLGSGREPSRAEREAGGKTPAFAESSGGRGRVCLEAEGMFTSAGPSRLGSLIGREAPP